MDWAEDYIGQCLLYIPKSKYRNRLQSELADHLTQLAADLEGAGYAPEEARAEALRQMGEAAALNERVKTAMENAIALDEIVRVTLNSDYNYTNTASKRYRYQAVFDVIFYD